VLRNRKQHDKPQATSAPSVNDPIAAPTQIQSPNPINSNVNPAAAMSQFLMQGPPMPGFSGSVAQYPMHYGIPGYPYVPSYPTPHGPLAHPFSFSQQYGSPYGPSRKRRYNWNEPTSDPVVSDDASAEASPTSTVISYPLLSDWLQGLTLDEIRGRDGIPYASYTETLTNNGILRLDDLTRFSATDLRELVVGMNIGTAARIADWAKADKNSLDVQERTGKGKKMRV
jgi:hypothetical protein